MRNYLSILLLAVGAAAQTPKLPPCEKDGSWKRPCATVNPTNAPASKPAKPSPDCLAYRRLQIERGAKPDEIDACGGTLPAKDCSTDNSCKLTISHFEWEPFDVPPIQETYGYLTAKCSFFDGLFHCEPFKRRTRLTCADKTRFLMTAEDGSQHCIALTPKAVPTPK